MASPPEQYIADVLSGKILVSEYARKAVERHVSDLEKQGTKEFPYTFSKTEGQRVIKFFSLLRHSKGEWAGSVFKLAPWQEFLIYVVLPLHLHMINQLTGYAFTGWLGVGLILVVGASLVACLVPMLAGARAFSRMEFCTASRSRNLSWGEGSDSICSPHSPFAIFIPLVAFADKEP